MALPRNLAHLLHTVLRGAFYDPYSDSLPEKPTGSQVGRCRLGHGMREFVSFLLTLLFLNAIRSPPGPLVPNMFRYQNRGPYTAGGSVDTAGISAQDDF